MGVSGGIASVCFQRSSMCARCGACGMGSEQHDITVEVNNVLEARVGDEVEVQFTARNALASSAIGYIFPLLMLFLGVFVGYQIPAVGSVSSDALAAICGIVFAIGSFFVLKLMNPWLAKRFSNVYTMTGKTASASVRGADEDSSRTRNVPETH